MKEPGRQLEPHFEDLFRSTRDDLLGYLLRRAENAEEAADLLAETYAIAWRRIARVPPGEEARLWLFGVARNLLRKGHTRQRSHLAVVARLANELQTSGIHSPDGEESEAVDAALARLPRAQREAVLLSAWEGMTPREIAAVIGAPVNLVRVRLHRARARLRIDLADLDPEGDLSPSGRRRVRARQTHGTTEVA